MNPFTNLPGYDADLDSEDIESDNQLRTTNKKIRRLKEKPILTKEQAAKLRIFESMVEEYENKGMKRKSENESKKKKEKKTKKPKNPDDDTFLDQEYQKNKEFWKKDEENKRNEKKRKEREAKEREANEREAKEREANDREAKEREAEEGGRRRGENNRNRGENKPSEGFFSKYKIEEIPKDILDLYLRYDIKKYKTISCKYHPDKGKYSDEYQKVINGIKSAMD